MSRIQHVILIWLICVFGLAIHLIFYVHVRPLWSDEAALAINIVEKSYSSLCGHLDAAVLIPSTVYKADLTGPFGGFATPQVAPIAFLWLSKAAIAEWGLNARTLQLLPLAAYFLFLLGAAWWLSRMADGWTGAVCLLVLALAAPLLEYSTEFKQYSFELMFSLLILAAFYPEGKRLKLTGRRCFALALLGAVSIWCSLSIIFVLGGAMIPLVYLAWRDRDWREVGLWCAVGAVSLLSFGVEYCTVLHTTTRDSSLYSFHNAAFGPLPPKSPADFMWYLDAFLGGFETPLGFDAWAVGLCGIAFLVGLHSLTRRNPLLMAALLGGIVLAFLAAQLHQYPWGGRFLIFLAMSFGYLLAEGLVTLVRILNERSWLLARALCVFAAGALLLPAQREFKRFSRNSSYRKNLTVEGVMARIQADHTPYDCVFIYQNTSVPFKFLSMVHHYRWDKELLIGKEPLNDEQPDDLPTSLDAIVREIRKTSEHRRMWILLSENHWLGLREKYIERLLDQDGTQAKKISDGGAVAFLYDFSKPAGNGASLVR